MDKEKLKTFVNENKVKIGAAVAVIAGVGACVILKNKIPYHYGKPFFKYDLTYKKDWVIEFPKGFDLGDVKFAGHFKGNPNTPILIVDKVPIDKMGEFGAELDALCADGAATAAIIALPNGYVS